MEAILADTSTIIEFFRPGGDRAIGEEIGRLLEDDRLALCGVVVAELFHGVRHSELPKLRAFINECRRVEFVWDDFETAGQIANSLRQKGRQMPLTDALIAAVALKHKLPIFSLDRHFHAIPGLRSHKP